MILIFSHGTSGLGSKKGLMQDEEDNIVTAINRCDAHHPSCTDCLACSPDYTPDCKQKPFSYLVYQLFIVHKIRNLILTTCHLQCLLEYILERQGADYSC